MSDKNKTAAGDFIMGVILDVFGVYLIISSLQMKIFKSFFDGPGFFPLILGIIFIVLGIMMTVTGVKTGGVTALQLSLKIEKIKAYFKNDEVIRVFILSGLMIVYIFGLVGKIDFTLATFLYLTATMFYLRSTKWWAILIISALAAILTSLVFKYAFKIPLP